MRFLQACRANSQDLLVAGKFDLSAYFKQTVNVMNVYTSNQEMTFLNLLIFPSTVSLLVQNFGKL